jgi:hypothetical protein
MRERSSSILARDTILRRFTVQLRDILTKQTSEDAIKFYSKKIEFLDKNMLDLEKVINGKASNAKGSLLLSNKILSFQS